MHNFFNFNFFFISEQCSLIILSSINSKIFIQYEGLQCLNKFEAEVHDLLSDGRPCISPLIMENGQEILGNSPDIEGSRIAPV